MVPALCFGAATPAAEVVTGCAVFSAVGVVLNIVVISWHRRLRKQRGIDFVHPIFQLIQEAQLWTYMVSMLHQCAVYPAFVVWGWLSWLDSQRQRARADPSAEHQFSWWATEPGSLWSEGSQPDMWQLRIFLYSFFGYLLRDMMMQLMEDEYRYLMMLHHVICKVGIISGLFAPHGGVAVVLGIFAFECGSFTYNAYVIDERMRARDMAWCPWPRWGRGAFISRAYTVCFTVSNVIGGLLLAEAVRQNSVEGAEGFAFWFAISGIPLCIMRQRECMDERHLVSTPRSLNSPRKDAKDR